MAQEFLEEDEVRQPALDAALIRRLAGYLRPYWGEVGLGALLVAATTGIVILGPYIIGRVIDEGFKARSYAAIRGWVLVYLAAELARFLLAGGQAFLLARLGQRVMHRLRCDLLRHLVRLKMTFFESQPVGRLVTRLGSDVLAVEQIFSTGIVVIVGDFLLIAGIFVAMILMHAKLGLLTILFFPPIVGAILIFKNRMRGNFRTVRKTVAKLNAFSQEHWSGFATVHALGAGATARRGFDAINREQRDAYLGAVRLHAQLVPTVDGIMALAIATTILLGGRAALGGSMTIGTLVVFISYLGYLFRPIMDITSKLHLFQSSLAAAERIFGILDRTDLEPASPEPAMPEPAPPREWLPVTATAPTLPASASVPPPPLLRFERVSFRYEKQEGWALRDVSFEILPGEKIGIVGPTGAGKTTLFKLFLRYGEPREGTIYLRERPLADYPLEELRRNFGLILQEPFLFGGNLAENCFIWADRPDEQLQDLARRLDLEKVFARRDAGWDLRIHESGANLSAGERQMITFLRALAASPAIMLLDEATSSIDPPTEALIQAALHELLRERTALVIAHRISTLQGVDRLLVLSGGKLEDLGTHQELLARDGKYRQLYELQQLAQPLPS